MAVGLKMPALYIGLIFLVVSVCGDLIDVAGNVWEIYYDEEHEKPYYHNVETDETTWNKPKVLKPNAKKAKDDRIHTPIPPQAEGGRTVAAGKSKSLPGSDPALLLRSLDFTSPFDHLPGVRNRAKLGRFEEKGLDVLFQHGGGLEKVKAEVERRLLEGEWDSPDVHLWNELGNVWRVKGDAYRAIDCFRKVGRHHQSCQMSPFVHLHSRTSVCIFCRCRSG
jgi:hypothetical protein